MQRLPHTPVLLAQCTKYLLESPVKKWFVDCTFGNGGYSQNLLQSCASCAVIALDMDETVQARAKQMQNDFAQRFFFCLTNFANMSEHVLKITNNQRVNGCVFDLGVSSMQLDTPERGFSFRDDYNGPLDMRMSTAITHTAADLVNYSQEVELASILFKYGDEPLAREISKAIVASRQVRLLQTTQDLAHVVRFVYSKRASIRHTKRDVCTRTFQALRIAVNDELSSLRKAMEQCVDILDHQGRLCIVTYHSGEDALVKHFTKNVIKRGLFTWCTRQRDIITASAEEVASNPRARSAKLRILQKM